jgi:hypothetical protein
MKLGPKEYFLLSDFHALLTLLKASTEMIVT